MSPPLALLVDPASIIRAIRGSNFPRNAMSNDDWSLIWYLDLEKLELQVTGAGQLGSWRDDFWSLIKYLDLEKLGLQVTGAGQLG